MGSHPTAIETLLVDQIIACRLECQFYQIQADSGSSSSVALGTLRLNRLESSQKRYLSSVRWLVQLRALVPRGMAPLNPCTLHRAVH